MKTKEQIEVALKSCNEYRKLFKNNKALPMNLCPLDSGDCYDCSFTSSMEWVMKKEPSDKDIERLS